MKTCPHSLHGTDPFFLLPDGQEAATVTLSSPEYPDYPLEAAQVVALLNSRPTLSLLQMYRDASKERIAELEKIQREALILLQLHAEYRTLVSQRQEKLVQENAVLRATIVVNHPGTDIDALLADLEAYGGQ